MVDHRKWYEVDIHACAAAGGPQGAKGNALAVNQDQRLFWQKTAQVKLNGAITTVADVQVNGAARLLRKEFLQVGGVADTQFLNVLRPVCVHRIWAGLFRCRNVRTGHDDAFDFGLSSCWRSGLRRRRWRSGSCWRLRECIRRKNEWKSDACHQSKTTESRRF